MATVQRASLAARSAASHAPCGDSGSQPSTLAQLESRTITCHQPSSNEYQVWPSAFVAAEPK